MDIKKVSFPSSMVDRITPATRDRDIKNFAKEYAIYDPALVVHEEFFQWVIEDKFSSAKPKFELAGIQMVSNVELYEKNEIALSKWNSFFISLFGVLSWL